VSGKNKLCLLNGSLAGLTASFLNELQSIYRDCTQEQENNRYKRHLYLFMQDVKIFTSMLNDLPPTGKAPKYILEGWAAMLFTRVSWINDLYPKDSELLTKAYDAYKSASLCLVDFHEKFDVYYSQRICGSHFAEHRSNDKQNFPYCGLPIVNVAREIESDPTVSDEIVVRVAYVHHGSASYWFALNNRGLAVLNLARVRPIRLLPVIPTQDELNRLSELTEPRNLPRIEDKTMHCFFGGLNKSQTTPYKMITAEENDVPVFSVMHYRCDIKAHLQEQNVRDNQVIFK